MSPRIILDKFCDVLQAVTALHRHRIIHRDLHPKNILVSKSGEIRLIDFSNAANLEGSHSTSGDDSHGSCRPPNWRTYDMRLSPQWDLFTMGAILFQLATGQKLWRGNSLGRTIERDGLPNESEWASLMHREWEFIVPILHAALGQRYPSVDVMESDLRRILRHNA